MTEPQRTTPRRLILLGSTGSIGTNTLAVVEHLHERQLMRFDVVGLAAGNRSTLLAEQAKRWGVEHVAVADEQVAATLNGVRHVYAGADAALQLVEAVARPGDLVLSAIVGSAGLPATIAAIEKGCDIALANKETLVAAGVLVMRLVRQRGVHLLPVDSEHSAIFQCLQAGRTDNEVKRLVLTASGGPFRTWPADRVEQATVEETLDHPTWDMGPKVTVDSASLTNKALEVIEAHWLFDMPADKIAVVVHPQSIVHSFVEFIDGSVIAQLSPPDMKSPIQYALSWPDRLDGCARTMDWQTMGSLDFEPVDHDRFPALQLAWRVIEAGGTSGAIFNAANEVAVAAFLDRRTSFGMITRLVERTMNAVEAVPVQDLDDIHRADQAARAEVARLLDGSLVSSNLP
ncbi:MAG: 1-deoxy-D-xylulose-5-phosphate reductoisomerase [Phycisphaerales bacterium]